MIITLEKGLNLNGLSCMYTMSSMYKHLVRYREYVVGSGQKSCLKVSFRLDLRLIFMVYNLRKIFISTMLAVI